MKKNLKKVVAVLPKTTYVLITSSERTCNLCGTHFEDDVCGSGHERGKKYPKTK